MKTEVTSPFTMCTEKLSMERRLAKNVDDGRVTLRCRSDITCDIRSARVVSMLRQFYDSILPLTMAGDAHVVLPDSRLEIRKSWNDRYSDWFLTGWHMFPCSASKKLQLKLEKHHGANVCIQISIFDSRWNEERKRTAAFTAWWGPSALSILFLTRWRSQLTS